MHCKHVDGFNSLTLQLIKSFFSILKPTTLHLLAYLVGFKIEKKTI